MTFEQWMREVDQCIIKRSGVGADDLADYAYRDAYDDEREPEEVADDVLAENGFPE